MAFKVKQGPGFDASAFLNAFKESVRKPDGSPYQVFSTDGELWVNLFRWLRGDGAFDGAGKSVADTINANADELNSVKADLDTVNAREKRHYTELRADLDAVMSGSPPFPE